MGWENGYKAVEALAPLTLALTLGFGSVKWWKIFSSEESSIIKKLVFHFNLPLLTFHYTSKINPFDLNLPFLSAHAISLLLVLLCFELFKACFPHGSLHGSITPFSHSSLANSLIFGIPLLKPVYAQTGVDLILQGSVVQALVWQTVYLLVIELGSMRSDELSSAVKDQSDGELGNMNQDNNLNGSNYYMIMNKSEQLQPLLEAKKMAVGETRSNDKNLFKSSIKKVLLKMASNPNTYSFSFAFAWAIVSKSWDIQMPSVIESSIGFMSEMGIGVVVFNMGMFMGLKKGFLNCGTKEAIIGVVFKFMVLPAAMAIASLCMGLHGDVLQVAIIQVAIQQPISLSWYDQEYEYM